MDTYDIIVIGAGPGGYVAAIRAAQFGAKTALIEREFTGGTCLNWGCIPTKTMVASAELYHQMLHADAMGLSASDISYDWSAILNRKNTIVKKLRQGIKTLLKANGVALIEGTAVLKSPTEVSATGPEGASDVQGKKIIIATGSESARPGSFPFDDTHVLDSKAFLDIPSLPKRLIIVGGGVIGCEFASLLNILGVEVTVVEMLDRLLPLEDKEISTALTKQFKKAGITVMTGAGISDVTLKGSEVNAKVQDQALVADMMLVAVGRAPNTRGIGLETVGIATEKSAIVVDDHMQTTIPGIYAIGDITGKPQLAHVASAQALVAAEHAFGLDSVMEYAAIPNCIFTIPEIATVGLNEEQARNAGHELSIGRLPFAVLGKAMAANATEGFYKIIGDDTTDEILGVQIFGVHATDMIAEAALAIRLECTVKELGKTIHAHPTLSEGLMETAHALHNECIHLPPHKKK